MTSRPLLPRYPLHSPQDVAPVIITGILAEGVEGVIGPIKVEEPSVPACQAILDEVSIWKTIVLHGNGHNREGALLIDKNHRCSARQPPTPP